MVQRRGKYQIGQFCSDVKPELGQVALRHRGDGYLL